MSKEFKTICQSCNLMFNHKYDWEQYCEKCQDELEEQMVATATDLDMSGTYDMNGGYDA